VVVDLDGLHAGAVMRFVTIAHRVVGLRLQLARASLVPGGRGRGKRNVGRSDSTFTCHRLRKGVRWSLRRHRPVISLLDF
jgi:hypothetical protein